MEGSGPGTLEGEADLPGALTIWWLLLCTAAAANVALWTYSARRLAARAANLPDDVYETRRLLLLLSAGYVLGCAFRSVFPMIDVPRLCLHDTPISRIFVGRSVATVAELCFAAQWALILREAGAAAGAAAARIAARLILPLIVLAEIVSWAAVLRANFLLHAVENSLWTLAAALAVAGFITRRARAEDAARRFLAAAILCGIVYVAFMAIVDVPMYLSRWQADLAAGRTFPGAADGLRTLVARCIVERDWAAWRHDVPWLTLYFTVAVWISIALAHAPPLRGRPAR